MSELGQALIFGLSTGGVIAVAALGLTLSFGVTRFINFAYGELMTVSAFAAVSLSGGLPLATSLLGAVAAAAVLTVAVAWLFYEPLRHRTVMALLITSIGVSFMLQNGMRIVFGADPLRFPVPLLSPWMLGPVFVPKLQVVIFTISALAMAGVHLLLRGTLIGRKMRAAADNDALARLSGIATRQTVRTTWLVTGVLAGVAGMLLGATQITVGATMGFGFLPAVFAATILGGVGQPYGAMLGAVIVGLGMELGATYISADYTIAFAFVALVIALLVRPTGLFGTGVTR